MPLVLLTGIVTGLLLTAGILVSRTFLPSPAFGLLPLLLTALPAIAATLVGDRAGTGRAASDRSSGFGRGGTMRYGAALAAAAAPFGHILLYVLTARGAMIGQDGSFLSFVLLTAWFALLVAAPIVLAGLPIQQLVATHRTRAAYLAGIAIAIAAGGALADVADIRIVFSVFALPALATAFLTAEPHAVDDATAAEPAAPAKTAKSAARTRTPAPHWGRLHTEAALALPVVLIPWCAIVLQRLGEMGLPDSTTLLFVLPLGIALAALAVYSVTRWTPDSIATSPTARTAFDLGAPILLVVFIALQGSMLETSLWSQLYLDAQSLGSATPPLHATLVIGIALLLCARLIAPTLARDGSRLRLGVATAAGVLTVLPAIESIPTTWATVALIAFLAVTLAADAAARAAHSLIAATVGVLALATIAWPLTIDAPPQRHFLHPKQVREIASDARAGGRMTLFLSRDYDDPFTLLAWNDIQPLTSNPAQLDDAGSLYGHLPLVVHGGARSVLVLGTGSGAVLEALRLHEDLRIDCVEPVPAVIALRDSLARAQYLPAFSRGATWHGERIPAFLARSNAAWDVIINPEPLATPFDAREQLSLEVFRDAAACLAPGGIFAQWLPVTTMPKDAVASVVAAFLAAFPHAEAWLANVDPDNAMLCLVGGMSPPPEASRGAALLSRLMAAEATGFRLRSAGVWSWADIAARFAMNRVALETLVADAAPLSVYDAPRALRTSSSTTSYSVTDLLRRRGLDPRLLAGIPDSLGVRVLGVFDARPALAGAALRMASDAAAEGAAAANDTTAIATLMEVLRTQPANGEARRLFATALVQRAAQLVAAQQDDAALPLLYQAAGVHPLTTRLLRLSMIASSRTGDEETAKIAVRGLRNLNARHPGVADNRATIATQAGKYDDALLLFENAITLDGTNEDFYINMAVLQYQLGRAWEAVRILDNCGARAYYPARGWYLQGMFYAQKGRVEPARESFERYMRAALPDDPQRAEVTKALADLERLDTRTLQPR